MPRLTDRPAPRIAQGLMAILLAALLALLLAPAARAGNPPTTDPALAAAGWLAHQVETDATLGVGSLADVVLAFAGVDTGADAAAVALARIEAGFDAYALPGGTIAPGALAKVMLAVQVAGADPNAFAGHDLEADLRGLLIASGTDAGRFGTASILDQSLAVLALARTTAGIPAPAVTWLVDAQCPSGEYAWDGSCPGPGAEDPDTTAIVIQALLAGGATAASDAAVTWLLSIQQPDGGIPSFGLANTNSTGVGSQALRAAGETAAADAAATFVASLQIGCDGDPDEVGAIGWAVGIPGFLVFSTPQALLAFGAPPLDQLSLAGAAPEAPVLDCPAAPAAPTPSPTVAPTPVPTPAPSGGAALPDTASAAPAVDAVWLAVALALGLGTVAIRRRRVRA